MSISTQSRRDVFRTVEQRQKGIQVQEEQNPKLQALVHPHIHSFNNLLGEGMARCVKDLEPRIIKDSQGNTFKFWIDDFQVARPMIPEKNVYALNRFIYPSECRERGGTYKGKMQIWFCYSINGGPVVRELRSIGMLPIMVKSARCNLGNFNAKQMVQHHEDAEELGGYFIINGIGRIIRLLIATRRHYVLGLDRSSFTKRGSRYTTFGCIIRCVRPDESAQTITVHYLTEGDCTFRFHFRKREYLIPSMIVLRAFMDASDKDIYTLLMQGKEDSTWMAQRVEGVLRDHARRKLYTPEQCLAFLGARFHVALGAEVEELSDVEVGRYLLKKVAFIHLTNNVDKFNLLIFMLRKCLALASGECCPDNTDSPMNQEVLLPGHLFQMYLKEKLDDYLSAIRLAIAIDIRREEPDKIIDLTDTLYIKKIMSRVPNDLGKKMEYMLATGNIVSTTGLDLQQAAGFTIVAENLNFYRYISHFRAIHRGQFFTELRTTSVRKLLPEAWGFLCPVHTPDGAPCGLLNHLSYTCEVVTDIHSDVSKLPSLLVALGMSPNIPKVKPSSTSLSVFLDGRIIGNVEPEGLRPLANKLRLLKVHGREMIPKHLEIACVAVTNQGQYPGLYLFSSCSRMSRAVTHLQSKQKEWIGTFEQVYLDVAITDEEIVEGVTTHQEISPTSMLSLLANLTPFSDFNQSPRNMYQCQMAKQTMGTPTHAYNHKTDNKMYRLQTGQTPIVRPAIHDEFDLDNNPNGVNAIVAVIAYTGYDMEDAMIINKSAYERGFGYGTVYKHEFIDLNELRKPGESVRYRFGVLDRRATKGKLDHDGLPYIGTRLEKGDPYYCVIDETTETAKIHFYKGGETAFVEEVRIIGSENGDQELQKVGIKLRVPRPPIIGDKFSSRHGQKGVLSQRYPQVDLPFTESGMSPDVIINPHAFPSRMTIGMLVESMAGKSGALHGLCQDATPFKFSENFSAVDYFGEQLLKAGYNYYGNEPMYSGVTGTEMPADIYIGVVYYQRLRHMVSDKFQVRTTGPVHALTQQPIKGRKLGGGIRLGEMERDSLLAHGVSMVLNDRLMNCSDHSYTYVCKLCGSLVSPIAEPSTSVVAKPKIVCRMCETNQGISLIAVPYVFRYLTNELLSMNVRLTLHLS